MGTIYTVSNTLAVPIVQKTLKLGNDPLATLISNLRKQARAKFDFSSSSHFSFLCPSKEKKLKAIITRAGFAEARNNAAAKKNAEGGNAGNNIGNNAENKNATEGNDRDNTVEAREKATASKSATTKDAVAKNIIAGMNNNAKNTKKN